jgi:hypothetical protein
MLELTFQEEELTFQRKKLTLHEEELTFRDGKYIFYVREHTLQRKAQTPEGESSHSKR